MLIMILEFSVENYKSFKELQTFTMQTAKLKDTKSANSSYQRTFEVNDKLSIVKTKAIYGGNSSGKSNLIGAMSSFWSILRNCLSDDKILYNRIEPFRLDTEIAIKPTFFQIIIVKENIQYRYGFEADKKKIHSEWLYLKKLSTKKAKETEYFIREGQEIISYNKNSFSEIKNVVEKDNKLYKENTLILTVLAALNTKVASAFMDSVIKNIGISRGTQEHVMSFWNKYSIDLYKKDKAYQEFVLSLLKSVDDTISNFNIKEGESPFFDLNTKEKNNHLVITRKIGETIAYFNFETDEGQGTQKIFAFSYPIYEALKIGMALFIDEFDARLHPKLTRQIIALFQSKNAYPEAQLIFVTHDTNLLDHELLRRDQITFVEKNKSGASEIFDLSDVTGVREDELFEKNYLKGKYGGLPYLHNLENLFKDGAKKKTA